MQFVSVRDIHNGIQLPLDAMGTGYFDGLRGERIGIFPLTPSSSSTFQGQEYLGLYPYFEKITDTNTKKPEPGFLR